MDGTSKDTGIPHVDSLAEHAPSSDKYYVFLEHRLMGSSAGIGDSSMKIDDLLIRAQEGDVEAYNMLLTPKGLLMKRHSAASIAKARDLEVGERSQLGGTFLDSVQQADLGMDRNIEPHLEPSELDPESGLVKPEWKVRLVHNDWKNKKRTLIHDPELLKSLKFDLAEDVHDYFEVKDPPKEDPDQNYRILAFKIPRPLPKPAVTR